MKRSSKKGFTLVELLVVIAILAILASVSVVGYLGFTAKANLSNDQQMIKMMNDNLMCEAVDGVPTKAGDAIQDLYKNGFNNEKLEPFSHNYKYGYNLKENKMYLFNENSEAVFPEESVNKADIWALYSNDKYDVISGVNNYVALDSISNIEFFAAGQNNIDLNGYLYTVTSAQGSSADIKVSNGNVIPGTGVTIEGNEVAEKIEFLGKNYTEQIGNQWSCERLDKDLAKIENNKLIIENLYVKGNSSIINDQIARTINSAEFFDSSKIADSNGIQNILSEELKSVQEVMFKNCVFDNNGFGVCLTTAVNKNNEPVSETFDGCTFMNATWGIDFNSIDVKVTVTNCTITNCERGIYYQPVADSEGYNFFGPKKQMLGSVIENTTFRLNNNVQPAISFAKIYSVDKNKQQDSSLAADQYKAIEDLCIDGQKLLEIRNNNVENAATLILLHECLNPSKVGDLASNVIKYAFKQLEISDFEKAFSIHDNKLSENILLAKIHKNEVNNPLFIGYAATFDPAYQN